MGGLSLSLSLGLSARSSGSAPFAAYPALAAAYGAGRGVIAIVGDSIPAGAGATTSGLYQGSSSITLISELSAAGIPAIDGFLLSEHVFGDMFTYDTRVTSTTPSDWLVAGMQYYTSSAASQLTFAPGFSYDRVRKGYRYSPGNGTYTLKKNGSTFATIDENTGGTSFNVATYNVTAGTQAIVIDANNVAPLPFIQAYVSTQHIQVCQMGQAGWQTINWSQDTGVPFDPIDVAVALDADQYVIWLGANDKAGGVATATFKSRMQTIITALQAVGSVVLAISPKTGGTSGAGADFDAAYLTAMAELVTTNSLPPSIDFNSALAFDFHNFDTDGLHPRDEFHTWLGQYMAANFRGTAYPAAPTRPVSGSGWGSTGTNVTLSGTNSVTATNSSGTEWNLVRSATAKTDRRFFEVKADSVLGGMGIGVCNATQALDGFPLPSANNALLYFTGNMEYNGVSTSSGLGAFTTGDTIGVDFDPPNTRVRYQKNGGAFTAWQSIPGVGGTVYAMAALYDNGAAVTANFSEPPYNASGSAAFTP